MFQTIKYRDLKLLISLIAIISSFNTFGQNALNNNQFQEPKRFFIGFSFSTDYDFRSLKNKDGSSSSSFVLANRNNFEIGKIGYTTGVNFLMNFTAHVGLETGVQYSNKGYKTKNNAFIYQQPDSSLPLKGKFIYKFHYIDIPLKINFTSGKNKFRFISSAGLIANIFVKETQQATYEYASGQTIKKSTSAKAGFKTLDISPLISIGILYKLNNKSFLKAEPTFRYGIINITDTPVTDYLWNAGLNIGYYYHLK